LPKELFKISYTLTYYIIVSAESMTTSYTLTKEGLAALEKMAGEGAEKASDALSKLIDKPISVETLAVRAIPVEKIPETIGSPEDMVTTIIMEVRGEVSGNIMLVYPRQSAINVADLLSKRQLGSTTQLSILDNSALKESGNIIAGSFLAALSDYLKLNMVESIPDLASDMLKATVDFVLARFAKREASEAVAFEIDFAMSTAAAATNKIKAYFILLLDVESASKMFESLKGISGGQAMTE
jgi:chemotaxis protein CheC